MAEIVFFIFAGLIIYAYIIYPALIIIIAYLKKNFAPISHKLDENKIPTVTLFVPAYNEIDYVEEKILNSKNLIYDKDKINFLWITDGSDDGTESIVQKYSFIECYHEPERMGKIAAMNRGMKFVTSEIVIFSDANTDLNKDAVNEIVSIFNDPNVGCVAGEKRIINEKKEEAAGAGEGIYWKYESVIKKCESDISSVIGAAGELFAIRTELFSPIEHDTILDDFIISMRIAMNGHKVKYTSKAFATESSSESVKEELKRKIRISAGGLQSIFRLKSLLNPFRYGFLTFSYISHKVLRWSLSPVSFFFIFPVNLYIVLSESFSNLNIFSITLFFQIIFYLFTFIGYLTEKRKVKLKFFFVPFYISMINYAGIIAIFKFLKKEQSVKWEKSKRKLI